MQIVCPACGKTSTSPPTAVYACERCGADLSRLRDIQQSATVLLVRAKSALTRGQCHDALAYAAQSWSLVRHSSCAAVASLAAAALGDSVMVARWRGRLE